MSKPSSPWTRTFSSEQKAAFYRVLLPRTRTNAGHSRAGYTAFMVGTTGPPQYIELRQRNIEGRVIWSQVIWDRGPI